MKTISLISALLALLLLQAACSIHLWQINFRAGLRQVLTIKLQHGGTEVS